MHRAIYGAPSRTPQVNLATLARTLTCTHNRRLHPYRCVGPKAVPNLHDQAAASRLIRRRCYEPRPLLPASPCNERRNGRQGELDRTRALTRSCGALRWSPGHTAHPLTRSLAPNRTLSRPRSAPHRLRQPLTLTPNPGTSASPLSLAPHPRQPAYSRLTNSPHCCVHLRLRLRFRRLCLRGRAERGVCAAWCSVVAASSRAAAPRRYDERRPTRAQLARAALSAPMGAPDQHAPHSTSVSSPSRSPREPSLTSSTRSAGA